MHLITLRLLLIFTALVCWATGSARGEAWTSWHNSLKPAGDPAEGFVVTANGAARCVIYLPQQATTEEEKAAEDLQRWLAAVTSAKLSIVTDLPQNQPCISIGNTSLASANRAQDLKDEGYSIALRDGNLILQGGKT